ncbi:hypothetical protein HK099_002174 [Clydaea vesicula]|uniref:Uncharacterized protein n=1 Tax=Clydaea vesicula TaxID=447962 RepID=A0AAD5UAP1_9FUNG|nr:hypothetical protein HK099_002174 [Clydaea vesicula]KAJ3396029.1 hypothetical protein HDU92_004332 [Lobulomyces angularis]
MKYLILLSIAALISSRSEKICVPTACHGVSTRCSLVSNPRENDCNTTSSDNHKYFPCFAALDPSLCILQPSTGECGWSVNSTFEQCLSNAGSLEILNNTDIVFLNTTTETSETSSSLGPSTTSETTPSANQANALTNFSGFLFIALLSCIFFTL